MSDPKQATLIIAGASKDNHRTLFVNPGTTAGQILDEQQLRGFQLSLGEGNL